MTSFRYDFTARELAYFLFRKKTCPHCGGRMEKEKCFDFVDGSEFTSDSVPLYIEGRQVKHYYYRYICHQCGADFLLTDLAKNNSVQN